MTGEVAPGARPGGWAAGALARAAGRDAANGGVVDRDVRGEQVSLGMTGGRGGHARHASALDDVDRAPGRERGCARVGAGNLTPVIDAWMQHPTRSPVWIIGPGMMINTRPVIGSHPDLDSARLTEALFDDGPEGTDVHATWRKAVSTDLFRHRSNAGTEERWQLSYDRLRALSEELLSLEDLARDPRALAALHEWSAVVDGATATVAGIHDNFFLGSLLDDRLSPPRDLSAFSGLARPHRHDHPARAEATAHTEHAAPAAPACRPPCRRSRCPVQRRRGRSQAPRRPRGGRACPPSPVGAARAPAGAKSAKRSATKTP